MKKLNPRDRIKARVRAKVSGTKTRPRFSLYKSNKYTYAQLIDDKASKTLIAVSDLPRSPRLGKAGQSDSKAGIGASSGSKTKLAEKIGEKLAKEAKKKNILTVVFDRNGYKYTGRVKALAEGARKEGLQF